MRGSIPQPDSQSPASIPGTNILCPSHLNFPFRAESVEVAARRGASGKIVTPVDYYAGRMLGRRRRAALALSHHRYLRADADRPRRRAVNGGGMVRVTSDAPGQPRQNEPAGVRVPVRRGPARSRHRALSRSHLSNALRTDSEGWRVSKFRKCRARCSESRTNVEKCRELALIIMIVDVAVGPGPGSETLRRECEMVGSVR